MTRVIAARGISSRYCVPKIPIDALPRPTMSSTSSVEQRLEQAVADAEHHQIVLLARLVERAEIQVMHLRLARQ